MTTTPTTTTPTTTTPTPTTTTPTPTTTTPTPTTTTTTITLTPTTTTTTTPTPTPTTPTPTTTTPTPTTTPPTSTTTTTAAPATHRRHRHRHRHRRHRRRRTHRHSTSAAKTISTATPPATATTLATGALSTASLTIGTTTTSGAASAQDEALSRLSALLIDGYRPPTNLVSIYKAAARRYDVPWSVLAAINAVETNYGRNLSTSTSGAIGWMQFMPSTWSTYAVAIGHVTPDPYNARDAIFAAARYLQANGGARHLRRAVFAYNHAGWYVDEVLWLAAKINGDQRLTRGARQKLTLMQATADLLNGLPYVWGGGHSNWALVDGYDCSGFVSAVLHAAGYLTTPVTTQTLPGQPGIASGPGRWVTIFDRTDAASASEDHVIIDINGQWWESGGSTTAGIHRIPSVSATYLLTFNLVLHPSGL